MKMMRGAPAEGETVEEDEVISEGDEARFMAFSSTDTAGSESPCKGRERSASFMDGVSKGRLLPSGNQE